MRVLEQGDIYFFYEPEPLADRVTGPESVGRLYAIPSGDQTFGRYCRLLALEGQMLPLARPDRARQPLAARVEVLSRRPEETVAALEARHVGEPPSPQRPGSVHRPVGEGRYAVVEHDGHSDLDYVLELPATPGRVQQELGIVPRASYRIRLQEAGEGRPVQEPFDLYEATELTLEAEAAQVPAEVERQLDVEPESGGTAGIFAELKLEVPRHPTEPLYQGEWH